MNLTESYVANFSEFRMVVDDVTPIIMAGEKLLGMGDAAKAKVIADPYIQYVVSIKNDFVGKQICCQNKEEAYILLQEFCALKDMPKTKDNYTYLIVLYCRILDSILCNTKKEMDVRSEQKKELLSIAKEISPWNSSVWEAMSRIANSDEEYNECIENALKYAICDEGPYGLGQIYANLAMHYVSRDVYLSQALRFMCKKYGGNSLAVDFALSKLQAGSMESEEAERILREAGIQIGYSRLVEALQFLRQGYICK